MNMIYSKADKQKVEAVLACSPELNNLAKEFHHTFGVMIGGPASVTNRTSESLKLYLDDMPIGVIGFVRDAYFNKGREDYYFYTSSAVSKEKYSKRSGRDTRDASKITGLISAIKKNNEGPAAAKDKRLRDFSDGIKAALNTVSSRHERSINVEIEPDIVTRLVEQYLGLGEVSFTLKDEIKRKHDEYMKKISGQKQLLSDVQRFRRGCKVIGILSTNLENDKTMYATAKITFDDRAIVNYTEPLKIHDTLSGTEYAADAAMIRTFMRDKSRYDASNEVGVGFGDHYFQEMDFSIGYNRRGEQWVLIPFHAE